MVNKSNMSPLFHTDLLTCVFSKWLISAFISFLFLICIHVYSTPVHTSSNAFSVAVFSIAFVCSFYRGTYYFPPFYLYVFYSYKLKVYTDNPNVKLIRSHPIQSNPKPRNSDPIFFLGFRSDQIYKLLWSMYISMY